ncbi:acyl-CoA dehydrogenase family protein [Streptomyces cinnamoneus]|uniref:acyl-CoA dehydrogenase family protein n=1 Tax=Streptomyces cinnamoneus TaxID=53446 RepID=UPI0026BCDE8C
MPRVLPDGTRNAMRLQRLKDKLGNRSNASAEIEYEQAVAWPVGEPGRGGAHHRRDGQHDPARLRRRLRGRHAGRAAAGMHHASHRRAFGAELIGQPLMRNVLADLAVESEAATVLAMRLAAALDRSEAGDAGEGALRRLGLAAGKYWVCKRGSTHAAEALECLGGNGYVEESGMPRLYRRPRCCPSGRGSGNVAALDVLRVLGREPDSLEAYFTEVERAAGADPRLDRGPHAAARAAR